MPKFFKKKAPPSNGNTNVNIPMAFHEKKPGRWQRFKQFFRDKFKFREEISLPETPEKVIKDFSSNDIENVALDIFAAPGSRAFDLLADLRDLAGTKAGVNTLSNILTQASQVIKSWENEYLQASKSSKIHIIQESLDKIDYRANFLSRAIKQCIERKLSADELHEQLTPLIKMQDDSTGLSFSIPIGAKELRAAVNDKNRAVFNHLSGIILKQPDSIEHEFDDDVKMVLKHGLSQITENIDVVAKLLSSSHLIDCAEYVAGLDLEPGQVEMQLNFIGKCADLLRKDNSKHADVLLVKCMQAADSVNSNNGELATRLAESSEIDMFYTLPQALEFIAKRPNDPIRKRIFNALIDRANFKDADNTILSFLSLGSDTALSGIKNAIRSGKVSYNDIMVMLYSRVATDVKSECLSAYTAASMDSIKPRQKTDLINAALDNGVEQSVLIQLMSRFSSGAVLGGRASDVGVSTIRKTIKYLNPSARFPSTDSSKLLVAAVDLLRQCGFADTIKENPGYAQQQLDDLLPEMSNSLVLIAGAAKLVEFAANSGLSLDNYLNNTAIKHNFSAEILSKSGIVSPGLLKPNTLMHFAGADNVGYIKNLPKIVSSFANSNSIGHEQLAYVLFTPHDMNYYEHKMRAVTEMIKAAPRALNSAILQDYIKMMMAVDNSEVLNDAKDIVSSHSQWVPSRLNKDFSEHLRLVVNGDKKITKIDLEKCANPLYKKHAEDIDRVNMHLGIKRSDSNSIFINEHFIVEDIHSALFGLASSVEFFRKDFSEDSLYGMGTAKSQKRNLSKLVGAGPDSEDSSTVHHEPVERLIDQIKNPLFNAALSIKGFDDNGLPLGNMVIPGKEYQLNSSNRKRVHEAQERLGNLADKFAIIGISDEGDSMEANVVKVASDLLDTVLEARPNQITKESFNQLMDVVEFVTNRVLQVYGVAYEPLVDFSQNIVHSVEELRTQHAEDIENSNFFYGRHGVELAETINNINDIMSDSDYANIRYAIAQPITLLAEVVYDVVNGDVKLTKAGCRGLTKLLNGVLSDIKQMSGFMESDIANNLQALTNQLSDNPSERIALHDSFSKHTKIALEIDRSVSPYVSKVVNEHLDAIDGLVKLLEKKSPVNASFYGDLHATKRLLSSIMKNAGDDKDDIANKAKMLKKRVSVVMDEAKANSLVVGVSQNINIILLRAKHAASLQAKEEKCKNFAVNIGTKIEKINEISAKIPKEQNSYLVDKKLSRGLDKAVAGFASATAVVSGVTSFPAHDVLAMAINQVSTATNVGKRSNNVEHINLMKESVEELTAIMQGFQETAKDFATPYVAPMTNRKTAVVDRKGNIGKDLTAMTMPPLPGMSIDNHANSMPAGQQNQANTQSGISHLPNNRYQNQTGLRQMHDMNSWLLNRKTPPHTNGGQSAYLDRLQQERQYSSYGVNPTFGR
ncbi:hypothetical protein CAXC1_170010 [Candidatus Xenohaliotis californiensis]|uniref:Uncharacterized protein n=1 Tax=Candidatus Xenohaliotis californiensis TaxID=84677 RepID=A0ABP0EUA1_9RICK|nr:hypothetical protein CAXC1_170010 [Candidatus Xenohaliotis californiensis]